PRRQGEEPEDPVQREPRAVPQDHDQHLSRGGLRPPREAGGHPRRPEVAHAHHEKQSVIHRDLKPHNVLVDKTMNPYVVDFGLAKEVDSGDGATLTGVVKGTPTYMAPGQAEGPNPGGRNPQGLLRVGAILYEMLTGRPPFLGE